jgi:hypothetical protein
MPEYLCWAIFGIPVVPPVWKYAVAFRVGEGEGRFLLRDFRREVEHAGLVRGVHLRADEGHDPRLRGREVAVEVDLDHRLDVGGESHGGVGLLRHVGLGEALQRHDDLGLRLTQDRADLVHVEQRVDRVRDPRNGRADQRDGGLVAVGQDVGDHVGLAHAQAAEEVRGLRGLGVELRPGQRLGLVLRARHDLEGDGVPLPVLRRRAREELVERLRHLPAFPRPHALDGAHVLERCETAHSRPPLGPAWLPVV